MSVLYVMSTMSLRSRLRHTCIPLLVAGVMLVAAGDGFDAPHAAPAVRAEIADDVRPIHTAGPFRSTLTIAESDDDNDPSTPPVVITVWHELVLEYALRSTDSTTSEVDFECENACRHDGNHARHEDCDFSCDNRCTTSHRLVLEGAFNPDYTPGDVELILPLEIARLFADRRDEFKRFADDAWARVARDVQALVAKSRIDEELPHWQNAPCSRAVRTYGVREYELVVTARATRSRERKDARGVARQSEEVRLAPSPVFGERVPFFLGIVGLPQREPLEDRSTGAFCRCARRAGASQTMIPGPAGPVTPRPATGTSSGTPAAPSKGATSPVPSGPLPPGRVSSSPPSAGSPISWDPFGPLSSAQSLPDYFEHFRPSSPKARDTSSSAFVGPTDPGLLFEYTARVNMMHDLRALETKDQRGEIDAIEKLRLVRLREIRSSMVDELRRLEAMSGDRQSPDESWRMPFLREVLRPDADPSLPLDAQPPAGSPVVPSGSSDVPMSLPATGSPQALRGALVQNPSLFSQLNASNLSALRGLAEEELAPLQYSFMLGFNRLFEATTQETRGEILESLFPCPCPDLSIGPPGSDAARFTSSTTDALWTGFQLFTTDGQSQLDLGHGNAAADPAFQNLVIDRVGVFCRMEPRIQGESQARAATRSEWLARIEDVLAFFRHPRALFSRPRLSAAWASVGVGPQASRQMDGAPTGEIAVSLVATGRSSGEVFQLQVLNPGNQPIAIVAPEALVLEPIKAGVGKPTAAMAKTGVHAHPILGYCLDFLKPPPAVGTIYRVADALAQQEFRPLGNVLRAARALATAGRLRPDSDPQAYLDSIKQWAVWVTRERWNENTFTGRFVERTRQNVQQMKRAWTKEMDAAIRGAAPNRWRDIMAVLSEARRIDALRSGRGGAASK
ncbi:MAG: hypothetical protein HYS05_09400 [Acidobacteria bacterium]|nr:hypothetical protein [Acidobacteriota bacterium]